MLNPAAQRSTEEVATAPFELQIEPQVCCAVKDLPIIIMYAFS